MEAAGFHFYLQLFVFDTIYLLRRWISALQFALRLGAIVLKFLSCYWMKNELNRPHRSNF